MRLSDLPDSAKEKLLLDPDLAPDLRAELEGMKKPSAQKGRRKNVDRHPKDTEKGVQTRAVGTLLRNGRKMEEVSDYRVACRCPNCKHFFTPHQPSMATPGIGDLLIGDKGVFALLPALKVNIEVKGPQTAISEAQLANQKEGSLLIYRDEEAIVRVAEALFAALKAALISGVELPEMAKLRALLKETPQATNNDPGVKNKKGSPKAGSKLANLQRMKDWADGPEAAPQKSQRRDATGGGDPDTGL